MLLLLILSSFNQVLYGTLIKFGGVYFHPYMDVVLEEVTELLARKNPADDGCYC